MVMTSESQNKLIKGVVIQIQPLADYWQQLNTGYNLCLSFKINFRLFLTTKIKKKHKIIVQENQLLNIILIYINCIRFQK